MDSKGLRNQKPAAPNLSGSGCPLIAIIAANEHGLVMMSRMGFEVGATVSLGFHLTLAGTTAGASIEPEGRQRSEFISTEAIIVESECHPTDSGEDTHRVTMLFSEISRRDRELLVLYSHQEQEQEQGLDSESAADGVEKLMDSSSAVTPSSSASSRGIEEPKIWLN